MPMPTSRAMPRRTVLSGLTVCSREERRGGARGRSRGARASRVGASARGIGARGGDRGGGDPRELRSSLRRAARYRRRAASHRERERGGRRRQTALGPRSRQEVIAMCHPEVPAGTPLPNVRTEEVAIELAGGEGMSALIAWPERTPAPAVLVINDLFGRSAFSEHRAGRLAQAAFAARDPELFFGHGALPRAPREAAMARRQKLDEKQALRDL